MTKILGMAAAVLALAAASPAGAATVVVPNADLNGDGKPDLIALYQGGMWCGSGGCSAVAVLAGTTGYAAKATGLPNFNEQVSVLDAMHNGMHDLRFDQATYVFTWSGSAYR
jgi:hypothetical protein